MDETNKETEVPKTSRLASLFARITGGGVEKKSENDLNKTRTLSIQNNDNILMESTQDIDKQISDLENVIKRLQNEIKDLSIQRSSIIIEDKARSIEKQLHDASFTDIKDILHEPTSTGIRAPLIVRDSLILKDDTNTFTAEVTNMLNTNSSEDEDESEAFSSIRKNLSTLWDLKDDDSGAKPINFGKFERTFDDNLENLIEELKAEITDKLEALKDVEIGQQLNNSSEDIDSTDKELPPR